MSVESMCIDHDVFSMLKVWMVVLKVHYPDGNQKLIIICAGMPLAGHLLSQRSPQHLTVDLIKALEGLQLAVHPARYGF